MKGNYNNSWTNWVNSWYPNVWNYYDTNTKISFDTYKYRTGNNLPIYSIKIPKSYLTSKTNPSHITFSMWDSCDGASLLSICDVVLTTSYSFI